MPRCLARTPAGDVVIRPARLGDAERLAEIHVAAIQRGCHTHYDEAQIAAWTTAIDAGLHRGAIRDQVVLVAERRRRVIGFGEYQPRTAQIVHLFVDPGVVACGLGTRLLAALEARAVSDSVQEVRLRASLNAAGFYERRGYLPAGGPRTIRMRDVTVPCLPMRKPMAMGTTESPRVARATRADEAPAAADPSAGPVDLSEAAE